MKSTADPVIDVAAPEPIQADDVGNEHAAEGIVSVFPVIPHRQHAQM